MLMWFCGACLEDQEGSVWDGWDKETNKCLCKKCKIKEPQNEQISVG